MDIEITKSHKSGGVWVHPGDVQRDVDEARAQDLRRNGLARPIVALRLRAADSKPASTPQNKEAPKPSTKAPAAKRIEPDVNTQPGTEKLLAAILAGTDFKQTADGGEQGQGDAAGQS
jgi:hypothetical protein